VTDGAETQILKGPGLTVSDRNITYAGGAIPVRETREPKVEFAAVKQTVMPTLLTIAGLFFLVGILLQFMPLWIAGLALAAFSPVLKINRAAYQLSVETGGVRKIVYATPKEDEAKLALAAVEEALKRAA